MVIHLFCTHRFDWSVTGVLSVISTLSTHISVAYLGRLNYTHLEVRLLSRKRQSTLTERKNLGQFFILQSYGGRTLEEGKKCDYIAL